METRIKTILVIDDDFDDYELIREAVEKIDASIKVEFLNRCEGVDLCLQSPVDMVILDINMPHHDGFYCLNLIRNRKNKLPVIMYTNSMYPAHITRAYNEGANIFYPKPSSFTNLVSGLSRLLNMDWSHPIDVTRQFYGEGKCLTFS